MEYDRNKDPYYGPCNNPYNIPLEDVKSGEYFIRGDEHIDGVNVLDGGYAGNGAIWSARPNGLVTIGSYSSELRIPPSKDPSYFLTIDGVAPWRKTKEYAREIILTPGLVACETMYGAFRDMQLLRRVNLSGADFSNVGDFSSMFAGCKSLRSVTGLENIRSSHIYNTSRMFSGCEQLRTLDLSYWCMYECADCSEMFKGCKELQNLDISGWEFDRVLPPKTDEMFLDCPALDDYINPSLPEPDNDFDRYRASLR